LGLCERTLSLRGAVRCGNSMMSRAILCCDGYSTPMNGRRGGRLLRQADGYQRGAHRRRTFARHAGARLLYEQGLGVRRSARRTKRQVKRRTWRGSRLFVGGGNKGADRRRPAYIVAVGARQQIRGPVTEAALRGRTGSTGCNGAGSAANDTLLQRRAVSIASSAPGSKICAPSRGRRNEKKEGSGQSGRPKPGVGA